MHFPSLIEIGERFKEEEGDDGVRMFTLDGVSSSLVSKRKDLDAARRRACGRFATVDSSARVGVPIKVSDRVAFFTGGSGFNVQTGAEAAVKKLEAEVARLEAKLTRQGAVLKADGTIDWSLTRGTVVYDHTAEAKELTRLRFGGGMIYTDDACKVAFDTTESVTQFGGPGWAIYVMSPTGNLHASPHSVGHRHHSSLLAGAEVAGAGEIKVLGGKLVHISNKSGHYAPGAAHLLQALFLLNKRGVDLNQTRVTFKTRDDANNFNNVQAFLDSLPAKGVEPDFEFTKLMAYMQTISFDDFNMMASPTGWRWATPDDQANGRRGVVDSSGVQVEHKVVRKWLKQAKSKAMNVTTQSGVGR